MTANSSSREPVYEVVSPLGKVAGGDQVLERRYVPDLNGKTIAFIWDYLFRGDAFFDSIREVATREFPRVKFVDHQVFGDIHASNPLEPANLAAIGARLRSHSVDAAVVAVGA